MYAMQFLADRSCHATKHGSLCSGSECGRYTHLELMHQMGIDTTHDEHTMCVESGQSQRAWINAHFSVLVLGPDVCELSEEYMTDLQSGRRIPTPCLDEADIGFSCTPNPNS